MDIYSLPSPSNGPPTPSINTLVRWEHEKIPLGPFGHDSRMLTYPLHDPHWHFVVGRRNALTGPISFKYVKRTCVFGFGALTYTMWTSLLCERVFWHLEPLRGFKVHHKAGPPRLPFYLVVRFTLTWNLAYKPRELIERGGPTASYGWMSGVWG